MTPISPKLTATAAVGLIVGLVLQLAATITPDTFAFLGKGEGLAFLVFTILAAAAAGWKKTDSLRDAGAAALQAAEELAAAAAKQAAAQASVKATAVPTVNPIAVQAPAQAPAAPRPPDPINTPAP